MDDNNNSSSGDNSSHSGSDNLVRMANQIGTFFSSMPDHKEAVEGLATHLKKFWDPRMRRSLLAKVDAGEAQQAGISEIVLSAVREHRAMLTPPA